jgi:hypothetical protein
MHAVKYCVVPLPVDKAVFFEGNQLNSPAGLAKLDLTGFFKK